YLSTFDYEVFISYSHTDNAPIDGTWVTKFAELLQNKLSVRLGPEIRVWSDARITGAEDFTAKILQTLRTSAVLVPIVAPSWENSDWCQEEHNAFQNFAGDDFWVENKCRVVKVIKYPLDEERRVKRVNIVPQALGF